MCMYFSPLNAFPHIKIVHFTQKKRNLGKNNVPITWILLREWMESKGKKNLRILCNILYAKCGKEIIIMMMMTVYSL